MKRTFSNGTRELFLTPGELLRRLCALVPLRRDDFEDPDELAKFAATARMSLQTFRETFEYLVQDELPPLERAPHEPELQ